MRLTRWWIRDAEKSRLLSREPVETADIDFALRIARKRFYHHVTVDNLDLRPSER